jgi:hypothetical protein
MLLGRCSTGCKGGASDGGIIQGGYRGRDNRGSRREEKYVIGEEMIL